jgi:hypothetical protein
MTGVLWDHLEGCFYHPPLDVDNTNFADFEGGFYCILRPPDKIPLPLSRGRQRRLCCDNSCLQLPQHMYVIQQHL